ncbi:MAG: radical SAM protein, partial [bacterium]
FDKALDSIFSLCNLPNSRVELGITGGEPLLNWECVKWMIEQYNRRRNEEQQVVGGEIAVTTNGSLLTQEQVAFLAQRSVNLAISLDGPEEIHNRQRPFRSGHGSYARVLERFGLAKKILHDHGLPITIHAVLMPDTQDPESIVEHALDIGADRAIIYPLHPFYPGSKGFTEEVVESYKRQYTRLMNYFLSRTLSGDLSPLRVHWTQGDLLIGTIRRLLNGQPAKYRCNAGIFSYTVLPDGSMFPCPVLVGLPEFSFGNVLYDTPFEMQRQFLARPVHSIPGCQGCWARSWCGGACAYMSACISSNLQTPYTPRCELTLHILRLAMIFVSRVTEYQPSLFRQLETECRAIQTYSDEGNRGIKGHV